MPFKPVPNRVDYVALEHDVQAFWDANDLMRKYLDRNNASPKRWSFIDGPITANNPMGVHHAWGRSYKDLYQRYKTMQGFRQRYQNGFDCQGLWVEVEVEKELGFDDARRTSRSTASRSSSSAARSACGSSARADRAVDPARLLDGLDRLVLHDVGREQLHDLGLPQEVPRTRPDLQGHRRHALVPALRDRRSPSRRRRRATRRSTTRRSSSSSRS